MWLKGGAIVLILTLSAIALHAQKLNYVQKDVSLIRLFKEIRKQTKVNVIWNEKEFNVNQKIDADFKNLELKRVMDILSVRLPVAYTFLGKNIIVKNRIVTEILSKPIARPKVADQSGPRLNDTKEYDLNSVEIFSTGYQRLPKERATGSFVLIDSALLDRRVSRDIFSRLEGIASGLLFNKNTLASGSGNMDLSIRGRSTIYANDQPLIILNDFPFNGDFNTINPNDVANVTVLKDAAAASIWGVRAGNGVIIISTKGAKYKQDLNVNFNSNFTFSVKPDVFYSPNYLSSSDFIDVETFLFGKGRYDAALADRINYPVVSPVVQILERQRNGQSAAVTAEQLNALRGNDIRKEELKYFYQKPVSQQYFVNISKGTSKASHYLSVGFDHEVFSLVNNEDRRLTLHSQHTVKLLKNLELNLGINYVRNVGTVDSTITGTTGPNFRPYYQFKDEHGNPTIFDRIYSQDFNRQSLSNGFLDWSYVPLEELNQAPINIKSDDLRLKGGLRYTIIPGLSAEFKYQYERVADRSAIVGGLENYLTRSLINQYSVVTAGKVVGYNIPVGPIQYLTRRVVEASYLRGQINYQKNWEKHAVSAIAGYELSEFDTQANKFTSYGYDVKTGQSAQVDTTSTFALYPSGTGKIIPNTNLFGRLDRIRSAFANIGYTYQGKYSFSASARMDGSNYFGVKTNQKSVPLWSTGALWHLDREPFYNMNWLPVLKLRATYGYNGNLDKNNTGITTFRNILVGAAYTNLPYSTIVNVGNPELRWEKIAMANFSLDFGLKDQVLTGKLEYYFKNGTDMLGDKSFPSSTGVKVQRGNYAEMKARGIDLSLTSQNLKGALMWQTNFFFSAVKDWITSYDVIETNSAYYVGDVSTLPVLDKPIYGVYSYKWAGLDPLNGDPRGYLNGEISKNYLGIINQTKLTDLEYHGSARPTVFGALNNTFSFHKFTLGFSLSYKLGYYIRKAALNYYTLYQVSLTNGMNSDFANRWQNPGDELITDVPSIPPYGSSEVRDRFYKGSSATIAKGDHVRLQDVSLSFDLDRKSLMGVSVKHMQLYLYATNLGLIWKANDFGVDPDFGSKLNSRFANPLAKSFSFGVKASF